MKKLLLIAILAAACGGTQTSSTEADDLDATNGAAAEPHDARVFYAKGQAKRSSSPDLIYHGGPVMSSSAAITPIFWGTTWTSDPQNKQSNLVSFYKGMSGSNYAGTNGEYTQSNGAHVATSGFSVNAPIVDTSAASGGQRTSNILAEVCKVIANPVANGYYPVYTDKPRGHAGYCAWHSAGTCNGVSVQFAFFWDLDGDAGCDPQSTITSYSQGVAALANVSGHELSETLTDNQLNAWYDSGGAENADKCAWTFGHSSLKFSNNTLWKVQGNYSNAAAAAKSGYDGAGCIDGN